MGTEALRGSLALVNGPEQHGPASARGEMNRVTWTERSCPAWFQAQLCHQLPGGLVCVSVRMSWVMLQQQLRSRSLSGSKKPLLVWETPGPLSLRNDSAIKALPSLPFPPTNSSGLARAGAAQGGPGSDLLSSRRETHHFHSRFTAKGRQMVTLNSGQSVSKSVVNPKNAHRRFQTCTVGKIVSAILPSPSFICVFDSLSCIAQGAAETVTWD